MSFNFSNIYKIKNFYYFQTSRTYVLSQLKNIVKVSLWSIMFLCLQCHKIWQIMYCQPNFMLVFIYYCSIYSRISYQYIYYFILGIVHDALYGIPLGQTSWLWGLVYIFLESQRKYLNFTNFNLCWISFSIFCLLYNILNFIIHIHEQERLIPWQSLLNNFIIIIAIYPIIVYVIQKSQKT